MSRPLGAGCGRRGRAAAGPALGSGRRRLGSAARSGPRAAARGRPASPLPGGGARARPAQDVTSAGGGIELGPRLRRAGGRGAEPGGVPRAPAPAGRPLPAGVACLARAGLRAGHGRAPEGPGARLCAPRTARGDRSPREERGRRGFQGLLHARPAQILGAPLRHPQDLKGLPESGSRRPLRGAALGSGLRGALPCPHGGLRRGRTGLRGRRFSHLREPAGHLLHRAGVSGSAPWRRPGSRLLRPQQSSWLSGQPEPFPRQKAGSCPGRETSFRLHLLWAMSSSTLWGRLRGLGPEPGPCVRPARDRFRSLSPPF
ncbi:laforin-like [Sorex araneus]|uniref:laforin-like n=1 Tax=Sorex araneus TaxID=42254 RepID=UPI0024337C92|nr:laforin-like [Sorex araneus]